jgi:DNA-binding response OmpR family regulator
MKKTKLLLMEQDQAILAVARDVLERDGYHVECAETFADGAALLRAGLPDLLVLDLELPGGDGLELCRGLSAQAGPRKPAIFLVTAKGTTDDIVLGLEAGAQDYMVKPQGTPFNVREFLARVRALSRRKSSAGSEEELLVSGGLRLSVHGHALWCYDKAVKLTLREFDVLRALMHNEGRVISRDEILNLAWEASSSLIRRVVDVHICHLRLKLGKEGERIETIPQMGFKLAAAPAQA